MLSSPAVGSGRAPRRPARCCCDPSPDRSTLPAAPEARTMQRITPNADPSQPSRRELMKAGAAIGAAVLAGGSIASGVHAAGAGGDVIKVGLVGCGARGTGAVVNALRADP